MAKAFNFKSPGGTASGGVQIQLTGPWAETANALNISPQKIISEWRKVARVWAGKLRDDIRKGYKKAKPGLAASTLLARRKQGRGGSKPLIVGGDLRMSVTVVKEGDGFFIGIKRGTKGPMGGMVNLGELHEFGKTFAVPATAKSKAFLADLFGNPALMKNKSDFFIVRIPARAVFGPAFAKFDKEGFKDDAFKRMQAVLFPVQGT